MHPDSPTKPPLWPVFAFLVYWPTMAALTFGLLVVDGAVLRPALIAIAVVSALVLAAGLAWQQRRLRPRSGRRSLA